MEEGGALIPLFGDIVGTGPGAGMASMFIIAGIMGVIVGIGGYSFPVIRDVEMILPDHDAVD